MFSGPAPVITEVVTQAGSESASASNVFSAIDALESNSPAEVDVRVNRS